MLVIRFKQTDELKVSDSYLESKQRWSGAAGDKFEQLSLLNVCELFQCLPEELDGRVFQSVTA